MHHACMCLYLLFCDGGFVLHATRQCPEQLMQDPVEPRTAITEVPLVQALAPVASAFVQDPNVGSPHTAGSPMSPGSQAPSSVALVVTAQFRLLGTCESIGISVWEPTVAICSEADVLSAGHIVTPLGMRPSTAALVSLRQSDPQRVVRCTGFTFLATVDGLQFYKASYMGGDTRDDDSSPPVGSESTDFVSMGFYACNVGVDPSKMTGVCIRKDALVSAGLHPTLFRANLLKLATPSTSSTEVPDLDAVGDDNRPASRVSTPKGMDMDRSATDSPVNVPSSVEGSQISRAFSTGSTSSKAAVIEPSPAETAPLWWTQQTPFQSSAFIPAKDVREWLKTAAAETAEALEAEETPVVPEDAHQTLAQIARLAKQEAHSIAPDLVRWLPPQMHIAQPDSSPWGSVVLDASRMKIRAFTTSPEGTLVGLGQTGVVRQWTLSRFSTSARQPRSRRSSTTTPFGSTTAFGATAVFPADTVDCQMRHVGQLFPAPFAPAAPHQPDYSLHEASGTAGAVQSLLQLCYMPNPSGIAASNSSSSPPFAIAAVDPTEVCISYADLPKLSSGVTTETQEGGGAYSPSGRNSVRSDVISNHTYHSGTSRPTCLCATDRLLLGGTVSGVVMVWLKRHLTAGGQVRPIRMLRDFLPGRVVEVRSRTDGVLAWALKRGETRERLTCWNLDTGLPSYVLEAGPALAGRVAHLKLQAAACRHVTAFAPVEHLPATGMVLAVSAVQPVRRHDSGVVASGLMLVADSGSIWRGVACSSPITDLLVVGDELSATAVICAAHADRSVRLYDAMT